MTHEVLVLSAADRESLSKARSVAESQREHGVELFDYYRVDLSLDTIEALLALRPPVLVPLPPGEAEKHALSVAEVKAALVAGAAEREVAERSAALRPRSKTGVPVGATPVVRFVGGEVWTLNGEIIILGSPHPKDPEEAHNCDTLGCGMDHVVWRGKL